MKADLATKFDLRVPRYTSYPTAPHFAGAVDGTVYRRWLTELSPDHELSLYFHIPYCDTLCWFCGCYTKIVRRYEPVARYLDMLLDEIDLVADNLGPRFRARHLHWGGGSPTLIKAADWQRLIERIYTRFDVGTEAEIAVEMDPATPPRTPSTLSPGLGSTGSASASRTSTPRSRRRSTASSRSSLPNGWLAGCALKASPASTWT